ncbi:MAG: hypothetical protein AAGI11_11705 [Pseudomonadota bacterium]
MMPHKLTYGVLFLPVLSLVAPGVLADRELYRYVNKEGNTVVDHRVPVEYSGSGYEVLNDEGIVVRLVPRELTEDEKVERDAERKRQKAAEAEAQRLKEWDESLMLRYSTVADIEDARERGLRDLRIRVSILKGNKRSLKQQVENYQSQAADLERRGMQVDVERLRAIESLQGEIATIDRAIDERNREIDEVSAAFNKDIARFEQLQDLVELRRTMLMAQDDE